ncbi:MAG TPA: hypothetical protein VFS21_30360 [Roseiflexaceae bacterium]|nr:hypothetical protein [Roseiflexaceae bacterium]
MLHEFPLERACALLRRLADDHLVPGGWIVFGDIAFNSVLTCAAAQAYWQDRWDEEEHYWAADEARPALRSVGLIAGYTPVSHCGGVFVLRERAQRPFHDPGDYADAAHDRRTPPEELRRLAASGYPFVLLGVAKHPRAEPDLLMSLLPAQVVSWGEQELAHALAEHPALPAEGLERLAQLLPPLLNRGRNQVYGQRAGIALCNNPNTPFAALRAMLAHPRVLANFRCFLAGEATRRDVLELLRDDRSSTVRACAERRLRSLGTCGT